MKKYISLVALLTLHSCTTVEFVRKETSPERRAVLRHSPPSNEKRAAKYKAAVDKKATEFCGGPYTIAREYQALETSKSSVGIGTGFGSSSSVIIGSSMPSRDLASYVEIVCR